MPRQSTKKVTKLESLERILKELYVDNKKHDTPDRLNDIIEQVVLEAIEVEKRNQSIKFLKSTTAEELEYLHITREEITEFDSYNLDRYIQSIE
jgi:hypothetical protein